MQFIDHRDGDELVSYDEIINHAKKLGINVTWRKLNYYKSIGLLPKPVRVEGDKRGHYPFSVIRELTVCYFLQNSLGFTLEEIKGLLDNFGLFSSEQRDLFSYWVEKTYGVFIQESFSDKEINKEFQGVGVTTLVVLNAFYKEALMQNGISYLKKIILSKKRKKVSLDEVQDYAKRWASKAAREVKVK